MYTETYEAIRELDDESMGRLMHGVFRYEIDGVMPEFKEAGIKMAWQFLKLQLDRNREKWEKTVAKRREAGRLGGLAKVANASGVKQSVANVANAKNAKHNVYVNVNDNVNDNVKEKESKKEKESDVPSDAGEAFRGFAEIAEGMREELIAIWPKCTASQFSKTVAKCWEYCTRDGKRIVDPGKTLRAWFSKQLDFMSGYEAGLVGPQTEEQWVKEYEELRGKKFTEKYGAEKAREVREWKFNKEMFGVYILSK